MFLTVGKSIAVAALLMALRWQHSASWRFPLGLIICFGALLAVVQSYRKDKFRWGIAFLVIAVLFNPFAPIAVSGIVFLIIDLASVMIFVLSFAGLHKHALPEPPSY